VALAVLDAPAVEPLEAPPLSPWHKWGVPAVALLGSQIVVWICAAIAGARPFSVAAGLRWDAGTYVDIAQYGYYLYPCTDHPEMVEPDTPAGAWCGNAGWFPIYPMLTRALHVTGIPYDVSAYALSLGALLGSFVLLWRLLEFRQPLLIALAALLPGAVYHHLTYPISLATLALLGAVAALRARSWPWAAACAALGAAAYPNTGLLVLVVPVAVAVLWRRWVPAVAAFLVGAAGWVFTAVVFRLDTGRWDAYFLIQKKYGNGVHNPLATANRLLAGSARLDSKLSFLAALVLSALVVLAFYRVRPPQRTESAILVALTLGLLVIPLIAGPSVSAYRSHALLMPGVLALRDLPGWLIARVTAVCAVVAAMIAVDFYAGLLP
jgi:hypothetical protein